LVVMMNWLKSFALVVLGIALLAGTAKADPTDGLTGEQIAGRIVQGSAFDWDGARTRMKMTLVAKDGGKRERALDILARKNDGLVQTVVRFMTPADVAGTAFLLLEQKGGGSDQYIYLPGLRRTRRIVGREREGSFMGSDFTYADLRRADANVAGHKRLADEKVGNDRTVVVESTPKQTDKSPYSKIQTWVRTTDFVPLRTKFYDTKGQLLKTLYARRLGKLEGKPVVMEARMENHQTGSATLLVIESIERQATLPDSAFTPTALEHR
jgi:outer membrane lipoprotein-sorting protein